MDEHQRSLIDQAWQRRIEQTGAAFIGYFRGCDREEARTYAESAPERERRDLALAAVKGDRQRQEDEIWSTFRAAMRPHLAALQDRLGPLRAERMRETQRAWSDFEAARLLVIQSD